MVQLIASTVIIHHGKSNYTNTQDHVNCSL